MDKTKKLKHIILDRYSSIREFAKLAEIPSTTLTSALDKGIGGMAIDRVIKICEILDIDVKTFEPLNPNNKEKGLSPQEMLLLKNFNKLNNLGQEKLIEYSNDLIETPKYIETKNNVTELTPATKKEYNLAAHDDGLDPETANKTLEKAKAMFKQMDEE